VTSAAISGPTSTRRVVALKTRKENQKLEHESYHIERDIRAAKILKLITLTEDHIDLLDIAPSMYTLLVTGFGALRMIFDLMIWYGMVVNE
jgi:hypothetical protein